MRLSFNRDYILVISPGIVKWAGKLTAGNFNAKGAAWFPFIFLRDVEYALPWLINHERIHFRQQIEMLFIGLVLLNFIERLRARFRGLDKMERYLYAASEQEAYLNMYNPNYLQQRPRWNLIHYITHKRRFRLTGPGEMEFLDI